MGTSATSRPGDVGTDEFPANVTANSSHYVSSLTSHLFTSEPLHHALIKTTQMSEANVTAPAPSCTDGSMMEGLIPNQGLSVSTAAITGASLLQRFPSSADTKLDASVVQHRGTAVHLSKLDSASTELLMSHTHPQSSTSPDVKPVLAVDVPDQDVSGQLLVTVPKVDSSFQESLQPHITCSSLHYVQTGINCPDIGQASTALSVYSVAQTSNTVADCHQVLSLIHI